MLIRFCLYGFLKNQRYFEPFLVLAFMARGLSFFEIGLLIAAREVTTNLLEVVSGGVADVWGRRRAMIAAWVAYLTSFVVFALADHVALLVVAMCLYGAGDAFRSGTHKAMIFAWLRGQGREDERTQIYGLTRSWSKLGSALSVVLAASLVLLTEDLVWLFWAAVIPYLGGLINFLGYPKALDGEGGGSVSVGRLWRHLGETLMACVRAPALRGLVLESMAFGGLFKAAKDYLQPVLQAAAVLWLAGWATSLGEAQHTALLVGPVYFGLYLMSAFASRRASKLVERAGGEARAARWAWGVLVGIFVCLLPAMVWSVTVLVVVGFVAFHVLHDAWRPILVSRFDTHSDASAGATIMSVESQARSLATVVMAPALGALVDLVSVPGEPEALWPVGAVGLVVGIVCLLFGGRTQGAAERPQPG